MFSLSCTFFPNAKFIFEMEDLRAPKIFNIRFCFWKYCKLNKLSQTIVLQKVFFFFSIFCEKVKLVYDLWYWINFLIHCRTFRNLHMISAFTYIYLWCFWRFLEKHFRSWGLKILGDLRLFHFFRIISNCQRFTTLGTW